MTGPTEPRAALPGTSASAMLAIDFGDALRSKAFASPEPARCYRQEKRKLRRMIREAVRRADGHIVRRENQMIVAAFQGINPAVAALGAVHCVRGASRGGKGIRVGVFGQEGPSGAAVPRAGVPRRCKAVLAAGFGFGPDDVRIAHDLRERVAAVTAAPAAEGPAPSSGVRAESAVAVGPLLGAPPRRGRGVRSPPPPAPPEGAGKDLAPVWEYVSALSEDVFRPGRAPRIPRRSRTDVQELVQRLNRWSSAGNLLGLGVGRGALGREPPGDWCVKFYVRERPATAAFDIPESLHIPEVGDVPAVVDELGDGAPHVRAYRRPAFGGFCVGHCGLANDGGSIGCLVRLRGDASGRTFLLSAAHILTDGPSARPGDDVWQRCGGFGGGPHEALTRLFRYTPLLPATGARADAAIAGPVSPAECAPEIAVLGIRPAGSRPAVVGGAVRLVGAGSDGLTAGTVDSFALSLPFFFPRFGQVRIYGLGLCRMRTRDGDSGATVLDDGGFVVGLHVGAYGAVSVFCRIEEVLDALRIDLAT